MTIEESHTRSMPEDLPPSPGALADTALDAAIAQQQQAVAAAERAFIEVRERFDRQRRRLRDLEEERERRRRAAEGGAVEPEPERRPRRRRSTTGMDALAGRDGIDPDRPFARLRLLSLQRQEVVLNHTGDREHQILGFVAPATGALHEAHTFGEGRRLQEQGCSLGWPGVPLQRQPIWYLAEGKPGWLRLDQLFVEQDVEDD